MNHKKILDQIIKESYQTTNMGNSLEDQAYVMASLCLGVIKRNAIEFNYVNDFADELQDKVIKLGVKLLNGEIKPEKYTTDFLTLAKKLVPADVKVEFDDFFVKAQIESRVTMSYGTGKKDRKQNPNFDKGKVTESKKNFKEEGRCGGSMKKEEFTIDGEYEGKPMKFEKSKLIKILTDNFHIAKDLNDFIKKVTYNITDETSNLSKIDIEKLSQWYNSKEAAERDKFSEDDSLDENMHGTPVSAQDLEKGKTYVWTGGAELLDIKYIGLRRDNADLPIGSSVGKGFVFQWVDSGKYLEVGSQTIAKDIIESDDLPLEHFGDGPNEVNLDELESTTSDFNPKTKMLAPFEEEGEQKLNPIAQWVLDHEKEISDESFYNDPKEIERISNLKTADEVEEYYVDERGFDDTDYLRKDLRDIMKNVGRIEASMGSTESLDELESTTDTFGTNSRLMEDNLEKIQVGDTFGSYSFPYSIIVTSIKNNQAEISQLVFYQKTGESVEGEHEFSLPTSEIERLLANKQWRRVKVNLYKKEPTMQESKKFNDINVWKQSLRESHGLVVYNEITNGKIAISQDRTQLGDWNETLCEGRIFKESVAISINEEPQEESFDETAEQMFENMLAEDNDLGEGDDVYYTAEGSDSKIAARIISFVRGGVDIEILRNILGYQVGDTIIVSKSELEKR